MKTEARTLAAVALEIYVSFFRLSQYAAAGLVPTLGGGRQGKPRRLNLVGVTSAILIRELRKRDWSLSAIRPLTSFVETLGPAGIIRALKAERLYLIVGDGEQPRLARQASLGRDCGGTVLDFGPMMREAVSVLAAESKEVATATG